jgi:hypothetical protein
MFLRNAGTYLSSDVALHTRRPQSSFFALRDRLPLKLRGGVLAHTGIWNSEGHHVSVPALKNSRHYNQTPICICMTSSFFTWCRCVASVSTKKQGDGQAGRHAWPLMATEECVGMVWNVNERSRIWPCLPVRRTPRCTKSCSWRPRVSMDVLMW